MVSIHQVSIFLICLTCLIPVSQAKAFASEAEQTSFKMGKRKRIALVAHDNKKPELLEWVKRNRQQLLHHELYGTGTTGKLVEQELNTTVIKYKSGPLGGDQ
ncbi:unnamed protein product, partial [Didymodactylos carnosus]